MEGGLTRVLQYIEGVDMALLVPPMGWCQTGIALYF